jgi:hypothetical protein
MAMERMLRAWCVGVGVLAVALAGTAASAQPVPGTLSLESLLKSGWQVTGYAAATGNRTAMILFKHPSESYLVQCLTGYDVTRTPREFVNCYPLR